MNTIAIIPARMGSTRFPGKPMVEILGIPMIGHVYYRTKMSGSINDVYIATCDVEIKRYADSISAPCIMTSDKHERASDRVAEAANVIEEKDDSRLGSVLMVQGDEPLVDPSSLDVMAQALASGMGFVNIMEKLSTVAEFESPDVVKVVVDIKGNALYFSREPIPSRKKNNGSIPMYKQTGLIGFSRDALKQYCSWSPTPLERAESVDMLRVIEHGGSIRMLLAQGRSLGVDTPADLENAGHRMLSDPFFARYRFNVKGAV